MVEVLVAVGCTSPRGVWEPAWQPPELPAPTIRARWPRLTGNDAVGLILVRQLPDPPEREGERCAG
jgi:hypothetical protein